MSVLEAAPGPVAGGPVAATTAPARALSRRLPPASVLASLAVLAVVLLWSLVPGLVTGHDPAVGVPDDKFTAPGAEYWLGTDHLGRDLLTRIIHGSASSMTSASSSSPVSKSARNSPPRLSRSLPAATSSARRFAMFSSVLATAYVEEPRRLRMIRAERWRCEPAKANSSSRCR